MGNRTVGIVVLILAVVFYLLIPGGSKHRVEGEHRVTVKLEDATGLPDGTPVYMAGLPIGVVESRRLAGRYAELTLRIDDDVAMGVDAILIERKPSLLSGPILELVPGDPSKPMPSGGEIVRVDESSVADDTLRTIDEAMPEIQKGADEIREDIRRARTRVRGDVADRMRELDEGAREVGDDVHDRLVAVDEWLAGVEDVSFDAKKEIGDRLDSAERGTAELGDDLRHATAETRRIGGEARERIDDFELRGDGDAGIDRFLDEVERIDRGEGTAGELVVDDELVNDIEDVVDGAAGFVSSITGWRVLVGFRNELNVNSQTGRLYVTLRLRRRPDSFYYLEAEKSPRGGRPEVALVYDPDQGRYRRTIRIEEKVRITFQWAKELGPLVLRGGLKESTFGVGADLLLGDRLELSADLFELDTLEHPRLKIAAAYRVFGGLYVLAGIDDILNQGRYLDIEPIASDVPGYFEELYIGRDVFFGGSLRFDDRDLAALMRIGGDALAGAAN